MPELSKIYLFRMTHIENIPHILLNGITHTTSPNRNPNFASIGDNSLISNRKTFSMPNNRTLGEYIPFYFGVRMPMLYVIQKGFNCVTVTSAENIVYCVTSVAQIVNRNLDFIFTNGHAVDCLTDFFYPENVQDIENLIDFKAINCKYWKDENDLDLKRRKEAEFLIFGDIPSSAIVDFVVYNENAKNKLLTWDVNNNIVFIRSNYYF